MKKLGKLVGISVLIIIVASGLALGQGSKKSEPAGIDQQAERERTEILIKFSELMKMVADYKATKGCDPWMFKCTSANDPSKYVCCGYESCCCAKSGEDPKCCYMGQSCWGPCCQK